MQKMVFVKIPCVQKNIHNLIVSLSVWKYIHDKKINLNSDCSVSVRFCGNQEM